MLNPSAIRIAASRSLPLQTLLLLSLALLFGGGQGWIGERLLTLPALLLAAMAILGLPSAAASRARPRLAFWLLPTLLLVLPLLQLLPLPPALWTHLPGRVPLATALLAAGISPGWHSWSLAPFATERIATILLIPVGLFMALLLLNGDQRRRLLWLLLLFAAANVLLGLWQLLEGSGSRFYFYTDSSFGDAVGVFANRNHLASLLAATLPVAVGTLVDRLRYRPQGAHDARVWALTAIIVLLAVGATATRSRAGLLLLMLSVLGSMAALWQGRRHRGQWIGSARWLRVSGLLALVLIVQYTLYALLMRLHADPLDDLRWRLDAQTLQLAAPAAGTGLGFGSFVHAYDGVGDASAEISAYINHAHDEYVELWLEGGWPALLLMVAAIGGLLWLLRRQWRQSHAQVHVHAGERTPSGGRDPHRAQSLGAAFALILLALHSTIDYPLRTLSLQCVAALLLAVLVGSVRAAGARGR